MRAWVGGINLKVTGDGRYTVRVRIEASGFMRHDDKTGRRFVEPVEVDFTDFEISSG